jgi:hypothetical protein
MGPETQRSLCVELRGWLEGEKGKRFIKDSKKNTPGGGDGMYSSPVEM